MNILVTGGCGYVGAPLTLRLLELGHSVTVVDLMWFGNSLPAHERLRLITADVRDVDRIPMEGIDAIIHLANIANDPSAEIEARLTWEVNVLASKLLVEKAIAGGVRQFIYASSGSVYGVKSESNVTEDLSLEPISDYNKTKMISERVLLSYRDEILVQCVRPATVCGLSPRMRLDLSVNVLTISALDRGRITVFGGSQVRPNIHLDDMIRVYLHLLDRADEMSGIFNAGFENVSIMEIARTVTRHVPVEIDTTESNDPRSYRLCSDKLLATGFEPKFGIEDAIRDLVEAYRRGDLANDDNQYNVKTMLNLATKNELSTIQ